MANPSHFELIWHCFRILRQSWREFMDNNIIPFPVQKVRPPEKTKQAEQKVSFALENRKVMISASLFSIVFSMLFFNQQFFTPKSESNTVARGIASVQSEQRDTQWEHALAKKLAESPIRLTASLGSTPNFKDKLKYESLKGNYMVEFYKSGFVKHLTYVDNAREKSHPEKVADINSFIGKHKALFPTYDSVNLEMSNSKRVEKVELLNGGKRVASIDLRLDKHDNLLYLSVNNRK